MTKLERWLLAQLCVCLHVSVGVCVSERGRERETEGEVKHKQVYPKQVELRLSFFLKGKHDGVRLTKQHLTKLRGFTLFHKDWLQTTITFTFLARDGALDGIKDGGMSPPLCFIHACHLGYHYLDWWALFQRWNCPSLCTVNSTCRGEWHLSWTDCLCVSVSSGSLVRRHYMHVSPKWYHADV